MSNPTPRYTSSRFVLATGFAQLPKGTPMSDMQKVFACSLVIDQETAVIADASFTFLMGLTEEFLQGLVIGRKLPEEWNELQRRFARGSSLLPRGPFYKRFTPPLTDIWKQPNIIAQDEVLLVVYGEKIPQKICSQT